MTTFERLLVVQDLDTRLDQLTHRRDGLEERKLVAEADAVLATMDGQIAEAEAVVAACRRDNKRVEDALATQEARAADIDAKLYGGGVTAARELQDLQTELDGVRRHISTIEDEDLETMEKLDAAEGRRDELIAMRSEIEQRRGEAESRLTVAAAEIDAEHDAVAAERARAVEGIAEELLAEYDRLRGSMGGVAVARLIGNRCEGCHLTLPAVEVDRIHRMAPEEPAYCDECGRLLVH